MKFYHIIVMILIVSCTKSKPEEVSEVTGSEKGLAETYESYFPIGVALSPRSLDNKDTILIVKEFNSVTGENVMKMGPIHPEEGRYNWEQSDQLVEFAQRNGMKVRGHALCWHEQAPDWMFVDDKGNQVSKDVLLARLKDHIQTIVSRYKGKIYAWDVVNEAIADDSTKLLRNSKWYQICGDDFIVKAFEYAHEADPEAQLFYNDYNADWPEKRDRIHQMVGDMIERGVPIHGIGMQGHWSLNNPTDTELRDAIQKYASLGMDIQITELDVSIYPWEKNRRERRPDESDELSPEVAKKQYERYQSFFEIFRENDEVITGVTFWGLTDAHSWLANYPVEGRRNYPLLFDHDGEKKKAYAGVVNF